MIVENVEQWNEQIYINLICSSKKWLRNTIRIISVSIRPDRKKKNKTNVFSNEPISSTVLKLPIHLAIDILVVRNRPGQIVSILRSSWINDWLFSKLPGVREVISYFQPVSYFPSVHFICLFSFFSTCTRIESNMRKRLKKCILTAIKLGCHERVTINKILNNPRRIKNSFRGIPNGPVCWIDLLVVGLPSDWRWTERECWYRLERRAPLHADEDCRKAAPNSISAVENETKSEFRFVLTSVAFQSSTLQVIHRL